MAKKKTPEWLRWAYLALAAFMPFASWMDFRDYQKYNAYGLFSPEEWSETLNGFYFHWAILGLMCICFLYSFLVLTWDKNGVREHQFMDAVFSTALLLVWAVLPVLISIPDSAMAIWVIALILFLVITGRSWVKYFENKRLEEETYE